LDVFVRSHLRQNALEGFAAFGQALVCVEDEGGRIAGGSRETLGEEIGGPLRVGVTQPDVVGEPGPDGTGRAAENEQNQSEPPDDEPRAPRCQLADPSERAGHASSSVQAFV
jgi:hypothetical protein